MQGMILGAIVKGVQVEGRSFAGQPFDWLSAYSLMTGVALLFGYALLGSTWLVMKTGEITQQWARKCASYVLGYVGVFMGIVSISMPIMNAGVRDLWFSLPDFFYLLPVPLVTAGLFVMIWHDLHRGRQTRPFFMSIGVFFMGYLGLGVSLWPWLVPFSITFRQAAAAGTSQSFVLVGAAITLPVTITYTPYCYYVFRGKDSQEAYY